jgi:hypothetical protein
MDINRWRIGWMETEPTKDRRSENYGWMEAKCRLCGG